MSSSTQSFGNIAAGAAATNGTIGSADGLFDFKAMETAAPTNAGAGTSTAGCGMQDTDKAVGGMYGWLTDVFDFKAMGESEATGTPLASVTDLIIDPFNPDFDGDGKDDLATDKPDTAFMDPVEISTTDFQIVKDSSASLSEYAVLII